MKCHIEFDFTPQEARQFFGLPDLQPMQASIMAEIERRMMAEMDRFSPNQMLQAWLNSYFQGSEQIKEFFANAAARQQANKT